MRLFSAEERAGSFRQNAPQRLPQAQTSQPGWRLNSQLTPFGAVKTPRPTVFRCSGSRSLGAGEVAPSLRHGFEKFVTFAQPAHTDVLVFKHGLDDSQNRTRTQIVPAIKYFDGFENLFFAQSRVFEGGLLQAISMDDVGFVLLGEPAVLAGHLEQFGAGIRRGERNLDAEDVEVHRVTNRLLDGFF